jgi:hypothetical protein
MTPTGRRCNKFTPCHPYHSCLAEPCQHANGRAELSSFGRGRYAGGSLPAGSCRFRSRQSHFRRRGEAPRDCSSRGRVCRHRSYLPALARTVSLAFTCSSHRSRSSRAAATSLGSFFAFFFSPLSLSREQDAAVRKRNALSRKSDALPYKVGALPCETAALPREIALRSRERTARDVKLAVFRAKRRRFYVKVSRFRIGAARFRWKPP